MGDGRPYARSNAQAFYRQSPFYNCGRSCSDSELADMAYAAADVAAAKGYNIFVIFYDEENDDVASEFFEGLIRGTGTYRRTPNSEDLDEF